MKENVSTHLQNFWGHLHSDLRNRLTLRDLNGGRLLDFLSLHHLLSSLFLAFLLQFKPLFLELHSEECPIPVHLEIVPGVEK